MNPRPKEPSFAQPVGNNDTTNSPPTKHSRQGSRLIEKSDKMFDNLPLRASEVEK